MIKRILIITITFLIAISGFLTGFFSVGCMSVYAAVNDDSIYVPLREQSDLVKAFQSYCKSRDLTIEGSLTDAVTTFTTGAFNSACNELGINITQLQAEIKAEYDSSGKPIKFLLNDTGVMAMNRIFAQFLQDNELEVGDENVNKEVYDGWLFEDDSGNKCFVYYYDNGVLVEGTPYIYDLNDVLALSQQGSLNTSFIYSNISYDFALYHKNYGTYYMQLNNGTQRLYYQTLKDGGSGSSIANYRNIGIPIILVLNGNLILTQYKYRVGGSDANYVMENGYVFGSNNLSSTNIIIVSTTINNNVYEGDTIINNEGDIINNPQPNNPNDTIHNVPETPLSPNDDGGWDIDLPDIDIPNLPIGNLSEKFPFSIPWDLVAFYAMLDAEPEAPRFNGTMDLTLVQWNYDIDLSPFDSAAELCRKLQFGLFVVGLIVASRSIIRG